MMTDITPDDTRKTCQWNLSYFAHRTECGHITALGLLLVDTVIYCPFCGKSIIKGEIPDEVIFAEGIEREDAQVGPP